MGDSSLHARLSCSGSEEWAYCSGSVLMQARFPDSDTEDSARGTCAHWVVEQVLKFNQHLEQWRDVELLYLANGMATTRKAYDAISPQKPEDKQAILFTFIVDQDMLDAMNVMITYVRGLELFQGAEIFSEMRVYPGRAFNRNDCWGTADVTSLLRSAQMIEVVDYKHGFVPVNVTALQLVLYLIGAFLKFKDEAPDLQRFKATIVQPRAYHADGPIRSIEYTAQQLSAYVDWFAERAAATDDPNAPRTPGDHCRWCKARGVCVEHANLRADQARLVFEGSMTRFGGHQDMKTLDAIDTAIRTQAIREADVLSVDELGIVVRYSDLMKAWIDACVGQALKLRRQGIDIPGTKLVEGLSKRAFENPDIVPKKLRGMGFKKDEIYDLKLRTPKAILDTAKSKGLSEIQTQHIEKMITKPQGKITIAPASDPRKAVPSNGQEMFGSTVARINNQEVV